MRSKLMKIGRWTAAALVAMLVLAVVVTRVKHQREVDPVPDEQKIARTLEIIRTSTPENRKVLKVLFFGQSITRSGWDKEVLAHWHERYPNTVFVAENRALGGFPSTDLERTTEQNIAAFYPDLIVFHVYGDHHAYERIIRMFRSETAADIIVQTDHGEMMPDPPCTEGLQMTLHRQPGCAGYLWVHQRLWNDEMSYHKIPALAKKYGLAIEPQRIWWRDYLLRTHIDPQSMLLDGLHPNAIGKALIASFFDQYFDNLVERWNGQTDGHVVSIPVNKVSRSAGTATVRFDGSRLELLSSEPLAAWPKATIDGVSPSDIDGCYQASRASSIETVPDWPAVRRVTLQHDHVVEDWTATLTNISSDQTTFDFNVKGSVTGEDGSGVSTQDFVSKSGRLRLDAQDWMLSRAFNLKHVPLQAPFLVHWTVSNVCAGMPEVIDRGDGMMQYRYVLVTGTANKPHTVMLQGSTDGLKDVIEFRAYKPPLIE